MAFSASNNPSTTQPTGVFFSFNIGHLSRIYKSSAAHGATGPQYPVEAVIEQSAGGFEGKVQITLFDDAGREIEAALIQHFNGSGHLQEPIEFQWGYLTGAALASDPDWVSDVYETLITDVDTSIGKNHFTFNMTGTFTAVRAFFNSSKLKDGTIDEILAEYSRIYGYRIDVSPSFSKQRMRVPDPTGSTTSDRPQVFNKQATENDYAFLTRVLQYAVADDGKAGYILQHTMERGQKLLVIRRPDSVGHYRKYEVQSKTSDVVEWQPQLQLALAGPLQGVNLGSSGTRAITGDVQTHNTNSLTSDAITPHPNQPTFTTTLEADGGDTSRLEQHTLTDDATTLGRNVSSIAAPTRDPNMAKNYHVNKFLQNHLKTHGATLTVLGDPRAVPLRTIDVICLYPSSLDDYYGTSGKKHYSSGRWFVIGVTHAISLGSYHTVFELNRFGAEEKPGGS